MTAPLEDYALIGDTHTAALVGRTGSIDWLCLPRFDQGACFAALLGDQDNGRWLIGPVGPSRTVRRYWPETLVLETEFHTDTGAVRLVDCMPVRDSAPPCVLRRVEGLDGQVDMHSVLIARFDYGRVVPWLRIDGRRTTALAGPEALTLDADIPHDEAASKDTAAARFTVSAGQQLHFQLAWAPSYHQQPEPMDVDAAIGTTAQWWRDWAGRCAYHGTYREAVTRSLITLKALIYAPSGGIVAAPTTSLPEYLGGRRNWDYRFCWIRDATFALLALVHAGYQREAVAWREWLLRAVAGRPEQMQIVYAVDGTRRLSELDLDWLAGYEKSRPVRIGNAAAGQFQLDVYGELMDALHQSRVHGIPTDQDTWRVQCQLIDFLESSWQLPDNGIWEVRGGRRHFTHSKVMAWAAVDRMVKSAEQCRLDGPVQRWRGLRQAIFDDVCSNGFDPAGNTFTQYYGSTRLDAALLMMAPVGFLPASDPRIRGTVAAIERKLGQDGLLRRYSTGGTDTCGNGETDSVASTEELDGEPPGEGAFLPCSFWLADNYLLAGRTAEARALFERLLGLRSDLGLLSEEYDLERRRLLGNYPQALSHLSLVDTALNLETRSGPVRRRAAR